MIAGAVFKVIRDSVIGNGFCDRSRSLLILFVRERGWTIGVIDRLHLVCFHCSSVSIDCLLQLICWD